METNLPDGRNSSRPTEEKPLDEATPVEGDEEELDEDLDEDEDEDDEE